jgi:tetratricopeptide (TPR) repeat protein
LRTIFFISTIVLIVGAITTAPLQAKEIDPEKEYAACMQLARTQPEKGFENATLWRGLGGGDAASHCAAVSLLNMGHTVDAAERLESLAQTVKAAAAFKGALLGQAGQAWLVAGNPEKAESLLTAAIKLSPEDLSLYVDRSQAFAARDAFGDAARDLDHVIARAPDHVFARVYRASAFRQLDKVQDAIRDVTHALSIDPDHPEGLLESGIVRRLIGDEEGARRDWLQVIDVAKDSDAAKSAQANLERLDGGG